MLKFEITARLDLKELDVFIDKVDITGTPTGRLIGPGLPKNGTTTDETTRWKISFVAADFNPITSDFFLQIIDGNSVVRNYATVNMSQSPCFEGGSILDIYIKVDEALDEVNVGGIYRGSEPASTTVQTSINNGSTFEAATKTGSSPDTYERVYDPTGFVIVPQVKANTCPAVAIFSSLTVAECGVDITDIAVVYTVGDNKQVTITASGIGLTGSLEYQVEKTDTPTFIRPWQGSNVFQLLPSGTYLVRARDGGNVNCFDEDPLTIHPDLAGTLDITDVTTAGGSDGIINTNITGSGSYAYQWLDGPTTPNRTGLVAGTYQVTVDDQITGQQIVLQGTVNQPSVIPEDRDPFFEVPKTQSLHFVIETTPDYINTFKNLDNTLLRNYDFPFFQKVDYCQKKDQNDNFKVQFRSNLENNEAFLEDFDGNVVANYIPEAVVTNLGQTETFSIRIQNNGASQSRVYFIGFLLLPVTVNIGDSFEIFNNADGFNGTYNIVAIQTDAVTNEQYLVINKLYDIVPGSSTGEGRFLNELINFDIYEFSVFFSTIPVGIYRMKIRAYKDDLSFDKTAESEPIDLAVHHKNTNLIQFTNVDNAFDIDYQNNILHSIRVESQLYQRLPAGDSETIRNTDGSLALLSAKPQRKLNFQFWNLPPYLHELLFVVFKHDVINVNGFEVVTEENLQEPEYRDRNLLANSSIIIEAAKWFETYNGDDLGGISIEGGFIIANNGFIKR